MEDTKFYIFFFLGYEIISQLWHNLDAIIIVSSVDLTNRYNNWVLEQFGNQFLGVNAFGVGDTMRLS